MARSNPGDLVVICVDQHAAVMAELESVRAPGPAGRPPGEQRARQRRERPRLRSRRLRNICRQFCREMSGHGSTGLLTRMLTPSILINRRRLLGTAAASGAALALGVPPSNRPASPSRPHPYAAGAGRRRPGRGRPEPRLRRPPPRPELVRPGARRPGAPPLRRRLAGLAAAAAHRLTRRQPAPLVDLRRGRLGVRGRTRARCVRAADLGDQHRRRSRHRSDSRSGPPLDRTDLPEPGRLGRRRVPAVQPGRNREVPTRVLRRADPDRAPHRDRQQRP